MNDYVYMLIQQAGDHDPDIRRQSAIELGKIDVSQHREEVLKTLLTLLGDENIAVREAAEETFVTIDGRDAVAVLVPCLEGRSTTVLNYAIEILSKIGHADIDLIEPLLESKDHDARKFGCDILGNLKHQESVFDLIELLNDPHINVAIAAGEALGKLGRPEAVPHLIRALQHPDTWMKCIAAEALGKIGDKRAVDPFIALSMSEDPIVIYTVIKAMGNFKDERVLPYIISIVRSNPMFAPSAAQALGHLAALQGERVYEHLRGSGISEHFVRLLSSENLDVLRSAIHLVGQLRCKQAIQPLGELLRHERDDIVDAAASALVQMGETGLDEIHQIFEQMFAPPSAPQESNHTLAPDFAPKVAITKVLGEIGDPRSIPFLEQALHEKMGEEVRLEAITALGKILQEGEFEERKAAFENLKQGVSDSYDVARATAAEILGKIGVRAAFEPVVQLLKDPVREVREAASIAISNMHNVPEEEKIADLRALLHTADESLTDEMRASVVRTIARTAGEQESEWLLGFLSDAASSVRVAALEATASLPENAPRYQELPELIIPLLQDADYRVRVAAVEALTSYVLRRQQQAEDTTEPARSIALEKTVFPHVLSLLSDEQARVSYEACQQLAKLLPYVHLSPEQREALVAKVLHCIQEGALIVKIAAVEVVDTGAPYLPELADVIPACQQLLSDTTDTELKDTIQHALSRVQKV